MRRAQNVPSPAAAALPRRDDDRVGLGERVGPAGKDRRPFSPDDREARAGYSQREEAEQEENEENPRHLTPRRASGVRSFP